MSNLVKKVTSALLTSAVVLTAVSSSAGVNAAYTNLEAANMLASQGVIVDQSTNPSEYRLADSIQRKEALKIMMKLSGQTVSEGTCVSPFADIANTDWACKYAVAALNSGFIAANTNYRPNDQVSKIEGLKMVMQARGISSDATTDWRAGYVSAAVTAEIATAFSDYDTSVERGLMFVWAAEAIKMMDETVVETPVVEEEDDTADLLGALLGGLEDEVVEEEAEEVVVTTPVVTPTTPVVSGDDVLMVSLNPETPSDGLAPADTARVPLLKFDVRAGSEDVTLNQATLEFIGLGDYGDLNNVSIYDSRGQKVSKTKSFSKLVQEISFDRDVIVEAGTTMTLTVAGMIGGTSSADSVGGSTNSTYGVQLVDLSTSSDVEGENLVGALLVPAVFSTTAALEIKKDEEEGTITVGEETTLAGFTIEEKNNNEDVLLESIVITYDGTVDEDDISDLYLTAEGKVVATDLFIDGDDEIVAYLDMEIAADEKVDFELIGTVKGSIGKNETVVFKLESDAFYAKGARSFMTTQIKAYIEAYTDGLIIGDFTGVEGSEINVSFDRSSQNEIAPSAQDVEIGVLELTSSGGEYDITEVTVTLADAAAIKYIDTLELDGDEGELRGSVFTFTDLNLPAGETVMFPLTLSINDKDDITSFVSSTELKFTVKITEVEDLDNDETYKGDAQLKSVLSTTFLSSKTIDVESATLKFTNTQVNQRELVLGDDVETVIYKAKITAGDADDVTINDIVLILDPNASSPDTTAKIKDKNGDDIALDKIIANATLNIGGETFEGDVNTGNIEFSNIDLLVAAGASNIEVLVTAVLADASVANGEKLRLLLDTASLDIEDSEGEVVVATGNFNTKTATTLLREKGKFSLKTIVNGDNKDEIEDVVLAGANDVALAELQIDAEYEDIEVGKLSFTVAGDFSDSLTNVRIVDGSTVLADNADVELVSGNTVITFDDVIFSSTDDRIDVLLVADVNSYSTEGDETQGQLGDMKVTAVAASDVTGESSNDDITGSDLVISTVSSPDTIVVVPALVTVSTNDRLGNDDKYATVTFSVDKGDNDFDTDDIIVSSIKFQNFTGSGVTVRNDDDEDIAFTIASNTLTFTNTSVSEADKLTLNDDDTYTFKVDNDDTELRIVKNGVFYGIDVDASGSIESDEIYQVSNDSPLDLGEYNESK